ncbi:MAG: MBL fold metallo-hydrolase [Myxococcota bacterium]|nr:MBL fold metallo-hydrolase [Myxococcota bacterium]
MRLFVMQTLSFKGFELEVFSIGGIESCYRIPNHKILFDIGRCPPGSDRFSKLFLSHSHIDHAGGLPYYVSMRNLKQMSPPTIYCPKESRENLWKMLKSWTNLDADADRCELIGVEAGEEIALSSDRYVRAFGSPHRVPVRGYTLFRRSKKLKSKYQGESSTNISQLVKQGTEVHESKIVPEFCFPGDSMIEVLNRESSITQAKILLLECTFAGSEVSVKRAKKAGHIHLDQIAENADRFENEAIVLTHWSQRYSNAQIAREVEKALPEKLLERVHIVFPRQSDKPANK